VVPAAAGSTPPGAASLSFHLAMSCAAKFIRATSGERPSASKDSSKSL
jgi:hypothetical protein